MRIYSLSLSLSLDVSLCLIVLWFFISPFVYLHLFLSVGGCRKRWNRSSRCCEGSWSEVGRQASLQYFHIRQRGLNNSGIRNGVRGIVNSANRNPLQCISYRESWYLCFSSATRGNKLFAWICWAVYMCVCWCCVHHELLQHATTAEAASNSSSHDDEARLSSVLWHSARTAGRHSSSRLATACQRLGRLCHHRPTDGRIMAYNAHRRAIRETERADKIEPRNFIIILRVNADPSFCLSFSHFSSPLPFFSFLSFNKTRFLRIIRTAPEWTADRQKTTRPLLTSG